MPKPLVENLLRLQECDVACSEIERQLEAIPREIRKLEARIGERRAHFESLEAALRGKEIERKELEGRVADCESQAAKYKTQQLSVKKNEEYQALNHEISQLEERISSMEDDALNLLMEIDEMKEQNLLEKKSVDDEVAQTEDAISLLHKNRKRAEAELEAARERVAEAAKTVPASDRTIYSYVKTRVKRGPYVVGISNQKCGGCHLKVSNEIAEAARNGESLQRCDSCGRIVFWTR